MPRRVWRGIRSSAKKDIVEVRGSKLSEEILNIFKKEYFISNYKLIKDNKQGILRVYLKYAREGSPRYPRDKKDLKAGFKEL